MKKINVAFTSFIISTAYGVGLLSSDVGEIQKSEDFEITWAYPLMYLALTAGCFILGYLSKSEQDKN